MTPSQMASPRRVLVLKLLALGDVIMASTIIGAIRRQWPEVHLTWATGARLAPLVSRFSGVDRVLAIDETDLLTGRGLSRVAALLRAWYAIGRGGWDIGFVGHTDTRYKLLLAFAGIRDVRMHREGSPRGSLPTDRWMGFEYAAMVSGDGGVDEASVELAQLQGPSPRRTREVLLAPGGARNLLRDDHLRRWPLAHWVQLAGALCAAGERVVLIGAPEDAAEGTAIAEAVPQVENAIGKTSLPQLIDRVAGAQLLITHDSGTLHVAALTRTPVLALFGPTNPVQFVSPRAAVTVASAAASLACAPCYNGRHYAPCTLNRCLADLGVESVVASARVLLGDQSVL